MTWLISGSLLAALFAASGACAQTRSHDTIDELYQRGQHEMAPNWRPLGKTHHAAVFIHKDIRRSDKGDITLWTDRELPLAEYFEKEKAYLSIRERMVVDCKGARIGVTDTSMYSERFGGGAIVGATRTKNPDMTDVVPDSIEDQMLKVACAPKPRSTPSAKPTPRKAAPAEAKPAT
ncbi:surface-adhesin E family protein [Noviherbaspirillum sp. Root189]|uniref:surface-adhesin E family protein n=1 Tax=Noviherbaspirillum sp. Root189 TaxID=1736487 RepID=UPI000709F1D3|nr:surface-adhesin E family protein [Noviherbaspirillum sp. Root189]KRB84664.1 hypothetical protein ASE07_04535 [Noviherbaspirillum sp. Root189]